MGVQYSGGVIVDASITIGASTMPSLILGVALNAAAAGWAVTTLGVFGKVFGNTNASNGQTTTIGGRVYTYKTVVAVADDILLGGSALETLQNFKAAINGEPGSGTLYGPGTTPSTTVVAPVACVTWQNGSTTFAGATLVLYTKGGAVALSDSSNFSLSGSSLTGAMYKMVSVQTPTYQMITAYIASDAADPSQFLNMFMLNRNVSGGLGVAVNWPSLSQGQTYRFIGHRYGFHIHISGTYGQRGQALYLQNPFLEGSLGPFSVSAVTLGGGGTTADLTIVEDISAAGWETGDSILTLYNNNTSGTGVDGTHTITVNSAHSVTISGLTASGTFTSGLGLIANQTPPRRQQLECIIADCLDEQADSWPVASTMYFGQHTAGSSTAGFHGIIDGAAFSNDINFIASWPVCAMRNSVDGAVQWSWGSGDDPSLEPGMCFFQQYGGNVTGSATNTIGARMGQLYNAYLIQNAAVPGGNTSTYQGHNFVGVYNNDTYCQLMLAIT